MTDKDVKKKKKDPRIECEYEEEMELTDPTTGKKFKQKVKVVRYKALNDPKSKEKSISEELEDDVELVSWEMEDLEESDD